MEKSIAANSRQVPKVKTICADKKYYDILYSYLQCISNYNETTKVRSFSKKAINFSKLGEQFGLSRQTVSTKFKNLKELGLVNELANGDYELRILEKELAFLVPYDTLKLITDALSENSVSTYVYLLNRYWANEGKPFQFTLEQIKSHIGICTTTRSNDNVITNILFVLEKIGLIKYSLTTIQQETDSFQNIKTVYQLNEVNRDIKK